MFAILDNVLVPVMALAFLFVVRRFYADWHAWLFALYELSLRIRTQARLIHMMIHDGSQIVQTFEDSVESWANLVSLTIDDCNYILQLTYGGIEVHDCWEYASEEKCMTEQSIDYFNAGNVDSRNLDGTVNDASNLV